MPPKKANTELSYYGFSKSAQRRPNWFQIANQLNIRPTAQAYANINDNTARTSGLWKGFAKQVKNNLIKKYEHDTQLVIQPYRFSYKIRYKNDKKWRKVEFSGQVQGRRDKIGDLVMNARLAEIDRIEQDSPYDSKDFGDAQLGETAVAPVSGGKLVAKGIRVAKMRKVGALKLDVNYVGDTSWDRKENTCVFDYLYHSYAGKSGFKKFLVEDRETAYDNLNTLFCDEENPNPLEEGVSINQLEKFCERFDVGMIALDKNEKLICYRKSSNRNAIPLIFIVSNNHFYPIQDKGKRLSVSAQNKEADKPDEEKHQWKSEDYAYENEKGSDKPDLKIVYPDEDELDGNTWAIKKIFELDTIPNNKSIRVDNNTISSFKIGDTLYITKRPDKSVLKYFDKIGEEYKGQSISSLLMDCWNEFDNGVEVDEDEWVKPENINSVVNPLVHRTLTAENVKYRTHYGATKDLTELDELILPPVFINMKYMVIEKKPYKNIFTGETMYETKEVMKYHKVYLPPKKRIQKLLEDGDLIAIDINKCYASCLKNPYDNWLKFGLEDTWEDYDNELKTGLYFVETDDMTLLHKTNIYSNKIIELAIKENIQLKIVKQLVHKKVNADETDIPKSYFHPLLELTKEKAQGTNIAKLMNNMITGYLGKTEKTNYTAEVDMDYEAVWRHFLNCERPENDEDFEHLFFKDEFEESGYNRFHKDNLILNTLEGEDNRKLYLYGYEIKSVMNEYRLPLYIQILDWANMKLYELGKKVGGEVIFRHTDCILSLGGKYPIRDMTNCWGDYSTEIKDFKIKSAMKTDRQVVIKEFNNSWKHNPQYKNSNDWRDIIKYAIDNGGLLIEGRAGTGKSFVPKSAFKEGLMNLEDKVEVDEYGKETKTYCDTKTMSFTNKASRNIMGTTIHKLLHITSAFTIPKKTMNSLKKYKYFVIDEIGMINEQLWKFLMLLKKENPKAIFILLGDWRQLPPIDEGRIIDSDIFNHPVVKFLCNNNRIELTEKQRYNQELWDFLEKGVEYGVWEGLSESKVSYDEIYTSKSICYYNKTRVNINKLCMDYYATQTDEKILLEHKPKLVEVDGKLVEDPKDRRQSVWLYSGLPVMSYKNNVKLGIVNSEEFMITECDEEEIILSRDEGGEDIKIPTDDFHEYFLANYASTAHKSQGATYKGKVILWDWDRMTDDKKLCYTACSRAVSMSNLLVSLGIKK